MKITGSVVLKAKKTMAVQSFGTTAASRLNAFRGKWQLSCSEDAMKTY